jgi:hypothetical protein
MTDRPKCLAETKSGAQCRKFALDDSMYCAQHATAVATRLLAEREAAQSDDTPPERKRWLSLRRTPKANGRFRRRGTVEVVEFRRVRPPLQTRAITVQQAKDSTRRKRAAADRAEKLAAAGGAR